MRCGNLHRNCIDCQTTSTIGQTVTHKSVCVGIDDAVSEMLAGSKHRMDANILAVKRVGSKVRSGSVEFREISTTVKALSEINFTGSDSITDHIWDRKSYD